MAPFGSYSVGQGCELSCITLSHVFVLTVISLKAAEDSFEKKNVTWALFEGKSGVWMQPLF